MNYKYWTTDAEPTEDEITYTTEYRDGAENILTIYEREGESITPESQDVKDFLREMGYELVIYNVSEEYGGHEPCTPDELYAMCDELGWERPELRETTDQYGRVWFDLKTGREILREETTFELA